MLEISFEVFECLALNLQSIKTLESETSLLLSLLIEREILPDGVGNITSLFPFTSIQIIKQHLK